METNHIQSESNKGGEKRRSTFAILFYINRTKIRKDGMCQLLCKISIDAEWVEKTANQTPECRRKMTPAIRSKMTPFCRFKLTP